MFQIIWSCISGLWDLLFQIIWSCISGLWELLCESMSYITNSQTPSSSPSDSMPSTTTSQAPSSSVSDSLPSTTNSQITSSSPSESMASQAPSSSVSDSVPSTTNSQTPSSSTTISQTQSTFVSSSTPTQYDVFLSFRGTDTRLHFTGHLHDKLVCSGIQTFMDDPQLRSGEVISDALVDAIRKSKAYIVVLSQNYASSSWCLDELVEILNCHKAAERSVIPVFYKIDPSVVRHQIGTFEQAFKKHQDRFEKEKVNKWRVTLTQVADFSGFHISENTSEAHVINEIVDDLLLKINPKTLDVTKYPVGLDSRVKAITTLLSGDTKGVIKFGIYGMGGVGKTTLAKALFNQLVRGGRFKGSCFLANVRENSGTSKGLVSLQMQLINDVLRSTIKVEVHNVDQGIKLIEARICSTKVVVVIDDLDDLKQFQSLVGPFASESVVIITTRDEEILIKTEVETRYRYMVNTLDDADSLALFMRHAFGDAEPNDTFMKLCEDILCLAGGLPLALEVFGSYLYKRSEIGWKSYIEKLHRNPNSSIQQRLVISLDALGSDDDPNLKKIFLDIACCFIGWEKQDVVQIIDSYYLYADNYIDMLKKRCLLTIDSDDRLEMHDLLQDVGKEIARKSSPDDPAKRSRLWVLEDICDVLKNHNGTEAIECISYRDEEYAIDGVTFTTDTFKRMSKLRFLSLENVNLTGSFEYIFKDLRWLHWDSCSLKCLPSEFYPQKLVILELPMSNMRTMWELNMASHVFGKLKTLNMSGSKDLSTTADFTRVPCLETLNLRGCASLEEVHMSIGSLTSLISLDLHGCVKLRSLPDSICNLRALKVLDVSRCNNLEALPIQLGNIESLTKLNANGLTVSKLPESIGYLPMLVELDLSHNKKLETLPDELWKITSLRKLDASYTTKLKKLPDIGSSQIALSLQELDLSGSCITALPSGFSQLSNLEKLDLHYCRHLLSIPKLPPSKIVELDLTGNEKLETLPDTICNLRSLEVLIINGCKNLKKLPDELWKITSLRELDASWTTELKKLPDIGSSQIALSLQELKLSSSGITALPSGFSQLSNLEILHLSFCQHLLSIPKLPPSLIKLDLSFSGITVLPSGFSQLSNLEKLDLLSCDHLLSIPKLPPNLKQIYAYGCESLERIPNLSNLKHLETLNLRECTGLTYIQGLEELNSIRELDFTGCRGLTYIQGLEALTSITILRLGGSRSLLLADNHLTKRLFQAYSELGRQIRVYSEESVDWYQCRPERSDWMIESPYWTSPSSKSESTTVYKYHPYWTSPSESTTVSAYLLPNESHNFMGIILCFKCPVKYTFGYSVKNTTSGFIWRDHGLEFHWSESLMVIVPKSIFPVRAGDHRIELTADNTVIILGIHLLYKTETEAIEDVVKKHETSFDALKSVDPVLQDIFLDIACFFIHWKKKEVVQILETYYTQVDHNIGILKNRGLLTINGSDELEMNDLVRHIGRKIASNNSLDEPGKQSRLWLSIDIYDVLMNHKGTEAIQGIIPRKLHTKDALEGESFTMETFKRMSKLRFLYLKKVNFKGSFEQAFEELRWFCWDSCPLKCLPSDFCPQELVILELPRSNMRTFQEPNMVSNVFGKLKTLNMSYSQDLITTPDFIKLPCLENLNLGYCKSLEEIHVSIGSLVWLVSLNLHGCVKLRSLPDTICSLRSLEILDIDRCRGITALPSGFSQLSNLQYLNLNLNSCDNLFSIPKLPPNLKQIYASGCFSLERLPNLSNLKQLEELNLSYCSGLTEIQGLEKLSSIRRLRLEGCRHFSLLAYKHLTQHLFLTGKIIARNNSPGEPGKPSRLWLSIDIYDVLKKQTGTETIKSIIPRNVYPRKDALEGESFTSEAFKKMSKLRFLYLKNANISGSFQQAFEDLRWLRWDSCPLRCFPSTFHPQKLVTLMLPYSHMRTMWEPNMVSHVFEKLKTLDMSFSQDLTTTPDFNKLPCLVTLILKGCISLEEVHISIGSLVRLVSLDLHGCVKLRSLPHSICNLRALKVLDIHDCCSLEAFPMALGSTKSPRELVAENLTVSKLPDSIEHLSKLVEQRYISNKNLESLTDTICNLRSLEILDISRCEKLEILLNQVFTLTRLRELNAGGATLLKIHPNIGLSQMALSLQKLDFSDSALTALPSAISQLTKVEYLDLKDCRRLLSITELPPNLKRIRASGCKSMQRFPNLSDLKQLEILELTDCSGLSDIQGLKGLTSVRDLHLEGCNSTFLAYIFTKCFFQIYSEFGHPIQISAPLAEFPYWIRQSSEFGSTMCLELLPNVSRHFLGMILCFKSLGSSTVYTIKNTTSDFKWSGSFCPCSRNPLMVIVPRSIFSVSNGDDKIELTTKDAEIYGIHLLYKTKGYDCE